LNDVEEGKESLVLLLAKNCAYLLMTWTCQRRRSTERSLQLRLSGSGLTKATGSTGQS